MRRKHLLWIAAAAMLLVLAYAWISGGREPLRTISEPVPVPEHRG
jgi:hypothetical protein